ncbi:DUF4339 domain-containing protein [Treponema sp. OMZ 792]|uniref:GYF domain-containing protein n=1 Tax=unclassified Treponema TaxID=2638727 RepID=UPI0020A28FA2|nr:MULTISPECIES: GYF domain-containing protein [unclassified Treponema]UTC74045.1 DUF4339 domain-containing protein [Treponema sp. OMZ 792]UTC80445.1 DUF4339 domain-containing protein [Treponema sp. OMZ 798]
MAISFADDDDDYEYYEQNTFVCSLCGATVIEGSKFCSNCGCSFTQPVPPPIPQIEYSIAVNGKAEGPFNMEQLKEMIGQGSLTKEMLVWKAGMSQWIEAEKAEDLKPLFEALPPPIPTVK